MFDRTMQKTYEIQQSVLYIKISLTSLAWDNSFLFNFWNLRMKLLKQI